MDQYYKLFGTCRIPNKNKDEIKVMQVYNIDLNKCNHVTVMYKKRVSSFFKSFIFVWYYLSCWSYYEIKIYSLQIIDPETGFNQNPHTIYKNLKAIVENSNGKSGPGLGILTASEDRDAWFDAYSKLKSSKEAFF
jgi:hypothetical protein